MKLTINNKTIETDDYVKKWTDWALEATPATDEEVIKNVQWFYKNANLSKPEVKVFRDYDEFINYDWASVGASVGASVRASVGASVWNSVRASVRASVGNSVWNSVGAWYWADDLSFADVFSDTNVLSKEKQKELKKLKEVLSTQRLAIFTEKVCYVLVAPVIRRNTQGQLHSDTERAVDCGKSGLNYLNGVRFDKELWQKVVSKEMTFDEIMKIVDIDQRTQAMKYCKEGAREFYRKIGGKKLDEYSKIDINGNTINYELWELPKGEYFSKNVHYVIYNCPSTDKEYTKGVPQFKTVAEAMAWGMSTDENILSPENWKLLVPLKDES